MPKALNWWCRKLHRWGAVMTAVPLLVVIATGLLLQVKKDFTWIQPPTVQGIAQQPQIAFDSLLRIAASVDEARIRDWSDVDRLDIRPSSGIAKIRAKNRWEIQVDTTSGEILSSNYRRSDLIETLHDGSWFGSKAKLWLFLPNGLILLGLWISGLYLWLLPIVKRRANRQARRSRGSAESVG